MIFFFLLLIIIFFFSCNRKTEFIDSKAVGGLFLIKNPPKEDSLLKKEIMHFLIKNPPKLEGKITHIDFYKYSWNTKYFLNHKEDRGGFSSEELGNYPEDDLASFIISKCKNDTTKLVGRFHFYGNRSNLSQLDTIIYKCD